MRRRNIGIDLHTNSFTACIRQESGEEEIQTWSLRKNDMERFVASLESEDAVALESTGNSAWFREQVEAQVARVVVVAPSMFEVIRRSTKKTDRHDARSIALFLSKDLLPEASQKSKMQTEIYSMIATRGELVKLRVALLNKVHALFVRHGVKIKKKTLTSKKGFESAVGSHEWSWREQSEIAAISEQLESLLGTCRRLEKDIDAAARLLPGYDCIISIKGIGTLSAALFLCTIGDIERFAKPGNLASYFGITPRVSQSNNSRHVGPITKHGDRLARTTLVQCALIAKKYSPFLKEFYERIKVRRGADKAIIATARKFLNGIFSTLKHGWVFEDFAAFRKTEACIQS